jgi:hypothetical protein
VSTCTCRHFPETGWPGIFPMRDCPDHGGDNQWTRTSEAILGEHKRLAEASRAKCETRTPDPEEAA